VFVFPVVIHYFFATGAIYLLFSEQCLLFTATILPAFGSPVHSVALPTVSAALARATPGGQQAAVWS